MRLGLISDIHGNRLALEAVVQDGRDVGVESWWVLGDLVAIGAEPVPTLELLSNLPGVRFVRGNTDRYVVTGDRPHPHPEEVLAQPELLPLLLDIESSFSWTRGALSTTGWLDWLADLALEQRAELPDGTRLLGVHASPRADDGPGIRADRSDEELATLLDGAAADLVCGGHVHQPVDRRVGPVRAVNLGSVSNPMTSDLRATYVVVEADPTGHSVVHRRVAYDHGAVIDRIERSGHPVAEFLASFQRGEQVRWQAEGL